MKENTMNKLIYMKIIYIYTYRYIYIYISVDGPILSYSEDAPHQAFYRSFLEQGNLFPHYSHHLGMWPWTRELDMISTCVGHVLGMC